MVLVKDDVIAKRFHVLELLSQMVLSNHHSRAMSEGEVLVFSTMV